MIYAYLALAIATVEAGILTFKFLRNRKDRHWWDLSPIDSMMLTTTSTLWTIVLCLVFLILEES